LGLHKVMLFSLKTSRYGPARFGFRTMNGVPALVCERFGELNGAPPRIVMLFQLDEAGLICEMDAVVAERKLRAVRFDDLPPIHRVLLPALRTALHKPAPASWLPEAARRTRRAAVRGLSRWVERSLSRVMRRTR
jgi:hypothetical protein